MQQRTTDDDEEVTLAGAQLQALGKIRVDLVRGKLGAVVNRVTNCLVNPDLGVASEKGKKYVKILLREWLPR